MATVATHGNEIVQGTFDQLNCSSVSQHTKIKKLLADLKSALSSTGGQSNSVGGGGNSAGHKTATATATATQKYTIERRITQLQTAIKRK